MPALVRPLIKPLVFDTRIFGLSCGRLELGDTPVNARQLDDLMAQAKGQGLRHIVVRVPAEWAGVCSMLESRGLRLAVCSLSLEKNLASHGPNDSHRSNGSHCSNGSHRPSDSHCPNDNAPNTSGSKVTLYTGGDDERLVAITAEAFCANTRFHHEPVFAPERIAQLHEEWIRNLIADASVRVFVCREDAKGMGTITGYVTLSSGKGSRRGHIGLIAVDSHQHRRGIGQTLLHAAERAMRDQLQTITVMTEGTNTAALHLYARTGYTVRRSWSVLQGCIREEGRRITI